jgi:ParB family protein of integrating conjugative element (PFGI_1 class)
MNDKLNVTRLPPPKKFPNNPGAREDILAGARAALEAEADAPPPVREPEQYRQLGLEQIQVYEHNPRIARNAQFDEIKEALNVEGLGKVLLHVTKRPGELVYTLSYGGATRFRAIQELWNETNDERFRAVRCLIQPFTSDLELRAGHIKENIQREDMTFWDTANAFVSLRRNLSEAAGGDLSSRAFVDACKSLGITHINITG